jgi:hypothetical protein
LKSFSLGAWLIGLKTSLMHRRSHCIGTGKIRPGRIKEKELIDMHLGSIFLPLFLVVLCPACHGTDQRHQQSAAQQIDTSLATARHPGGATRSRILISLRDGSQLMGSSNGTPLPFQTAYGELSVALEQARSLVLEDSIGTSTLSFQNGDLLHGRLTLKAVHIEGTLGPMDIPVAAITRISFLGTGSNVTEGLVAHYPLDGSTADVSGNGHDAVNHGGVPANDRFGNPNHAYAFDGKKAYIALPDGLIDRNGQAFSISFWALAQSLNDMRIAVGIASRNGEGKAWIVVQDRQFKCGVNLGSTGYEASAPAEPNVFVHLAGIYRRGQSIQLWMNGRLAKETPVPDGALGSAVADLGSTIGSYAPEEVEHARANHYWTWHGIIDDVRFYARALEPVEINALAMEKP